MLDQRAVETDELGDVDWVPRGLPVDCDCFLRCMYLIACSHTSTQACFTTPDRHVPLKMGSGSLGMQASKPAAISSSLSSLPSGAISSMPTGTRSEPGSPGAALRLSLAKPHGIDTAGPAMQEATLAFRWYALWHDVTPLPQ